MEAVQYKCPNCGGELQFKPDKQNFGCDYCMSSFTEDEIKQVCAKAENSIPTDAEIQAQNDFTAHTNCYHCGSCGAEIIAEDNQTATFCYYCHEPVILSGRLSGDYMPSKVIGFKLTRDNAVAAFKKWCGNRWFLPKDFNTDQQLEKMTGLYVPFWIADCDIKADFQAVGKQVRSWSSGDYRYTETKEYDVLRKANVFTDGIPADGDSKIEDQLMEAIEPFDYGEVKNFSMSYLSGFFANKYDVDKAAVFPRVKTRAENAAKKVIKDSIGSYSSVSTRYESYRIMNTEWEYMMMPVWFMTYKYNGEMYSFAVNGQTGKLAGTPPLNKLKLRLFSAGFGLATALIAFIIGGMMI